MVGLIFEVKRAEKEPADGLKPDTAVMPESVVLVLVTQFRFTPGSTRVRAGEPASSVLEKYSAFTPLLLIPF